MGKHFKVIYVKRGLEDRTEVKALLDSHSGAAVTAFVRMSEIKVLGNSMAATIEQGKTTFVITSRSAAMIERFVNHDPGSVCPTFYKLVPSTNCVYDCEYCFLQSTYRACRPFVCVYLMDLDKLGAIVTKKFGGERSQVLLNAGEMSDPLACDVLGYVPGLVRLFGELYCAKLLLLTKSGYDEIRSLLELPHAGHTVTAWSMNCPETIEQHEYGTAFLDDRLRAARAAQDVGYEVRLRLDPMLVFPGWEKAYERTISLVYSNGIRPARITLATFRMLAPLKHIIVKRFPDSMLLSQQLHKNGKRLRYMQEVCAKVYQHAIAAIRENDSNVPIALCKESPGLHQMFKGQVHRTRCNCQL